MTCPHEHYQPVEVRDHRAGKAEVVANICEDCLDRLPAGWGCEECEWIDGARRLCEEYAPRVLAYPCLRHRGTV